MLITVIVNNVEGYLSNEYLHIVIYNYFSLASDEESEELVTMEKADNIPQAVTSLVSTGKVLADVLEKLYSGDEHLDALDCEMARKISEHLAVSRDTCILIILLLSAREVTCSSLLYSELSVICECH